MTSPASQSTPFYASRTFWLNSATLVSLVFPVVREWMAANPETFVSALGAANVLLKFITLGKHQIVDDSASPDSIIDRDKTGGAPPDRPNSHGAPPVNLLIIALISIPLLATSCGHDVRANPDHVVISRESKQLIWDERTQTLTWRQATPATPPTGAVPVVVHKSK